MVVVASCWEDGSPPAKIGNLDGAEDRAVLEETPDWGKREHSRHCRKSVLS